MKQGQANTSPPKTPTRTIQPACWIPRWLLLQLTNITLNKHVPCLNAGVCLFVSVRYFIFFWPFSASPLWHLDLTRQSVNYRNSVSKNCGILTIQGLRINLFLWIWIFQVNFLKRKKGERKEQLCKERRKQNVIIMLHLQISAMCVC